LKHSSAHTAQIVGANMTEKAIAIDAAGKLTAAS
jgi:hypothetical protein